MADRQAARARSRAVGRPSKRARTGAAVGAPAGRAASDIAHGRQVLEIEAAAVQALAASLNDSFAEAVLTLKRVLGRVVVTGMGKSGHVARKIAATLASTGRPAQFVHPAEASHGDLGMITRRDAVLALSNSGETPELADLIAHTRRFAIPLIAMTAVANSALAQAADHVLRLPEAPEACPLGLAPTTSTTMMLALGDALAVALHRRLGFSARDFAVFHPRGTLGRKFIRVGDVMQRGARLPMVGIDARMAEAVLEMTAKRLGCVGVVETQGTLVGIITDGDLRRHMGEGLLARRAADVMTSTPRTITSEALAAEALNIMNTRAITVLFVVDSGKPVGILHVHDLLRAGVA
jgi:arabinose-5-phosphate isomerase